MFTKEDKEWMGEYIAMIVDKEFRKSNVRSVWVRRLDMFFKICTPVGIASAIWVLAVYHTESKTLMFNSPTQKELVINRFEKLPSEEILNRLATHVEDKNLHMPKKDKDSVYVTRAEFMKDKELREESELKVWTIIQQLLEETRETNRYVRIVNTKVDKLNDKVKEK